MKLDEGTVHTKQSPGSGDISITAVLFSGPPLYSRRRLLSLVFTLLLTL